MREYFIKLPRDIVVDIFNLPPNFKDIVEKAFSEYTEGTAKDYQYCDKLAFIDVLISNINNSKDAYERVNDLVMEKMEYEWKEYGDIVEKDDIFSQEFMEHCFISGQKSSRLYSHYGLQDHHIYDQIQKVIVKVIIIVMNYDE